MSTLTEIDVGSEGIAYLMDSLNGWPGLAASARQLPLSEGKALALVPQGTTLGRAKKFRVGYLGVGTADTKLLWHRFISLRQRFPQSSVIIQDINASPTDKCVVDYDGLQFFHDSCVYSFVNSHSFDDEKLVSDTIYATSGFIIFGFFVAQAIDEGTALNREIGDSAFKLISASIKELFVSAYDGESFVVWRGEL